MGAGAADIAEVVSDVREVLPDLKPPPALEPEQARFRLFDSITAFLKSAGRRQPLVLVLEDLHWADRPSLLLLEFLARELTGGRLLVIGTYRDVEVSRRHPLSQTLGELTRERLFQRVLLRGLGQEDVGRFIELVAGVTPPRGMVEAVYRQTEGNPLFVTEVVRLLVQEGGFSIGQPQGVAPTVGAVPQPALSPSKGGRPDTWTVRIPEGVREVIGRRLDRLSERCNQTLTITSVIGREFSLAQLKPLIEDMTEDRLLEVLEEALAARVIEELPRIVSRYQFTHALIQETLLEELTLTRRVRLHARIAEALEAMYGAQAEAHAAELAHHFGEAESVLGTGKLVKYSLLAGEKALAAYAWEEALAHFQRGLAAKEGQSPVGALLAAPLGSQGRASPAPTGQAADAETAALLFGLGRAQGAMLHREEAWASLNRAFGYFVEAGDIARAVAAAEALGLILLPSRYVAGTELITRALALVTPESHEAGHLLSCYGRLLGRLGGGDYNAAQEAFGRATAIAERQGDPALEAQTLASATQVDWWFSHWHESVQKGLRAIELAGRADNLYAEVTARWHVSQALCVIGDSEGARRQAAAFLVAAERLRDRGLLVHGLITNCVVAQLEGDWKTARGFSDRALGLEPKHGPVLGYRPLLEYQVGDFAQGEAYMERFVEVVPLGILSAPGVFLAIVVPMVAHITGVADRRNVAEAAAEAILSSSPANSTSSVWARAGSAVMAVLRGDVEAVREQYPTLESLRGTLLLFGTVSGDRLLGLLAQTMGNLDKAAGHFEDALAFCRKAGYRPELAWTCCDYADLLLNPVGAPLAAPQRAGQALPLQGTDRAKAMALLDEALQISSELGMRPLMERVLSRREILTA
jgi:tetratricopeptide (TPR) repeat protein